MKTAAANSRTGKMIFAPENGRIAILDRLRAAGAALSFYFGLRGGMRAGRWLAGSMWISRGCVEFLPSSGKYACMPRRFP